MACLSLVRKSGSWYSLGDDRIGQGRENAKKFLEDHPDALAALRTAILEERGIISPEAAES